MTFATWIWHNSRHIKPHVFYHLTGQQEWWSNYIILQSHMSSIRQTSSWFITFLYALHHNHTELELKFWATDLFAIQAEQHRIKWSYYRQAQQLRQNHGFCAKTFLKLFPLNKVMIKYVWPIWKHMNIDSLKFSYWECFLHNPHPKSLTFLGTYGCMSFFTPILGLPGTLRFKHHQRFKKYGSTRNSGIIVHTKVKIIITIKKIWFLLPRQDLQLYTRIKRKNVYFLRYTVAFERNKKRIKK